MNSVFSFNKYKKKYFFLNFWLLVSAKKFSFCPKNNGFARVWGAAAPSPLARTPMLILYRWKLEIRENVKAEMMIFSPCSRILFLAVHFPVASSFRSLQIRLQVKLGRPARCRCDVLATTCDFGHVEDGGCGGRDLTGVAGVIITNERRSDIRHIAVSVIS